MPISQAHGSKGEELDSLGRAKVLWGGRPPVHGNEGDMYPYFRFYARLVRRAGRACYKIYAATMTVCSSPIGHGSNASFNVKIDIPGLEKCRRDPLPDPYEQSPVVFVRSRTGSTMTTARIKKPVLDKLVAAHSVDMSEHAYLPASPVVEESDPREGDIFDRRDIPQNEDALSVTRSAEAVIQRALSGANLGRAESAELVGAR